MDHSRQNVIKAAFSGLSDKEIHTIINNSNTKKTDKSQVLIGKMDSRNTVYVVLAGTIRIIDQSDKVPKVLEILGPGSFVGETGFTMNIARTTIAVTTRDTTVLVIGKKEFESFSDGIRLYIVEKMNDLAAKRIAELTEKENQLRKKNNQFKHYLKYHYIQNRKDYSQSALFTNIIRKIPKLPTFTTMLSAKLLEDKLSLKEVSNYVQQDPALVGLVLKTINSAYYNFKSKISSIQRAILLLGFNRLYQLLVSTGIKTILPDKPEFNKLQTKAVVVSNIAYALSLSIKKADPVQISTIALLKDLGRIVTYLLTEQNKRIEILISSLDTSIIGALLLQEWNLPKIIWKSVEYQSCIYYMPPSDLPADISENVAIMHIAEICYDLITKKKQGREASVFFQEYLEHLGLKNLSVKEITDKHILPVLIKNIESYPEFLRIMVRGYL